VCICVCSRILTLILSLPSPVSRPALSCRYKEEKASLTQSNGLLLEQNRDLEASKTEIRGLAVKLLDLASQSSQGAAAKGGGGGDGQYKRAPPHQQAIQWEQHQQHQQYQQYQQYQQQQQRQHQHQQQMLSNSGGHGPPQQQHNGGGYQQQYQPQPQLQQSISNVQYSGEKGSPGSVNDGRGLGDQDQPWLPQTLEEHMLGKLYLLLFLRTVTVCPYRQCTLCICVFVVNQSPSQPITGTGAHKPHSSAADGYYGDDLSVGSQHTQHTQQTHQSMQSMLQGSPPVQAVQQQQQQQPRR